jgi:CcmD family protein
MPALPLDEAGKYVAGAYVVFIALVGVYVAIMAAKLARIERELEELNDLADRGNGARAKSEAESAPVPAGGGQAPVPSGGGQP